MKVLHINFSKSGGAGAFARDLASAQVASGMDVRLVNLRDTDLWSNPALDPRLTVEAILDEYVVKQRHFDSPISLIRNGERLDPEVLSFHPDVIHLHWVQGVISDPWLRDSKYPIVWTLHDFRPITGACHHPLQCTQMKSGCNSCPAVRGPFRRKVASSVAERLNSDLNRRITFVAPSQWVAEIAMQSSVLKGVQVPVIYNATPDMRPRRNDMKWYKGMLGGDDRPVVTVAFGASPSNLKGRDFLETFEASVFEGHQVITFGSGRLSWADKNLGKIDRAHVSALLSKSRLVIVPSKAETFSLVSFEATRFGVPVSGLPEGAVGEIARVFGHFVPLNPESISLFLSQPEKVSASVVERTMSDVVEDYNAVYESSINGFQSNN